MAKNVEKKDELIPYWIKIVTIFFFGWIALYGSRAVLSGVMDDIQVEFGLSAATLGLISSIFFIGYAALNIPTGILGDKIGKKKVLIPGVILFGAFCMVAAVMPTFILFMVAWLMVGIFQGFYYGPQYGLSTEAIPAKHITLGSAIINSGMPFGLSLGYYVSSFATESLGLTWRAPFIIIGIPIVIIGIAMFFVIKKDAPKAASSSADADPNAPKLKLIDLFKNRNLILAYITIFCAIYAFFVVVTWIPYYLQHARGIEGTEIAFVSSLVPWAAIPGSILFSWIADRMGVRRPVLLVMLPLSIIAVFSIVAFDNMAVLYAALIGYGIFGKISTNPVLVAVVADNAPKQALGTAFGLYNAIGMVGSILAPYITGLLVDVTGSLDAGFYFAGALLVVAVIAVSLIDEKNRPNIEGEGAEAKA